MEDQLEKLLSDDKKQFNYTDKNEKLVYWANDEIGEADDYVSFKAISNFKPDVLKINFKNGKAEYIPFFKIGIVKLIAENTIIFECVGNTYGFNVENSERFFNLLGLRYVSEITEYDETKKYKHELSIGDCKILGIKILYPEAEETQQSEAAE